MDEPRQFFQIIIQSDTEYVVAEAVCMLEGRVHSHILGRQFIIVDC